MAKKVKPSNFAQKSTPKRNEAFAIPEVLEQVLLHMDEYTLLHSASLVNKTFRAAIEQSPSLSRQLYLKSGHPGATREPVFNPFFLDRCIDDIPGSSQIDMPILFNTNNSEDGGCVPIIKFYFDAMTFENILGARGSWRRMLIARASESYTVNIAIHGLEPCDEQWTILWEGDIEVHADITMGTLLDMKIADFAEWAMRAKQTAVFGDSVD